jgi:capsule polysaccharide export protein KpsE/RkpR
MAKAMNIESATFNKEVDKEIAKAVVDDNDTLNQIIDEINTKPEVGSFTQDEVEQAEEVVEAEVI